MITNGLSFGATTALSGTIEVERVLANALSGALTIPKDKNLIIASGGTASAGSIKIGGKDFCYVKSWEYPILFEKDKNLVSRSDAGGRRTCTQDMAIPADTMDYCYDTSGETGKANRTCCEAGYWIFDINVNEGKMVCCRAR